MSTTAGPPPTGAAPARQNAAAQQPSIMNQVLKAATMYFIFTTASSYFLGGKSPIAGMIAKVAPGPSSGADPAKEVRVPEKLTPQQQGANAVPIWPAGSELSLSVYLSTGQLDLTRPVLPFHTFETVTFGNWNFSQTWETQFKLPESVQRNGSLIAEMFLSLPGAALDPRDPTYDRMKVVHSRKLLSRYNPEKKVRAVKNLLKGDTTDEEKRVEAEADAVEAAKAEKIISYYHPNLTLTLINEPMHAMAYLSFPPAVQQHVHLAPGQPDPAGFASLTSQPDETDQSAFSQIHVPYNIPARLLDAEGAYAAFE